MTCLLSSPHGKAASLLDHRMVVNIHLLLDTLQSVWVQWYVWVWYILWNFQCDFHYIGCFNNSDIHNKWSGFFCWRGYSASKSILILYFCWDCHFVAFLFSSNFLLSFCCHWLQKVYSTIAGYLLSLLFTVMLLYLTDNKPIWMHFYHFLASNCHLLGWPLTRELNGIWWKLFGKCSVVTLEGHWLDPMLSAVQYRY